MEERAVETTDVASVEKAFSDSQIGTLKNEDLGQLKVLRFQLLPAGPSVPTSLRPF